MALIRFLFHPLLWLLLIVLVVVYLYRETLFPDLSQTTEVRSVSDRIDGAFEKLQATMEEAIESKEESDLLDEGDDSPAKPTLSLAEEQPVQAPVEPTSIAPTSIESASIEPASIEPEVNPITQDELVELHSPVIPQQEDDQAAANDGPDELWYQARAALWQGELEHSAQLYRQLVEMDGDNFDAHGELGNVYLLLEELELAVDAYSQAALAMSRAGHPQIAWRVLDIVARLDHVRAESLYLQLREQQLSSARPR